jgi:hypothetical protein
LVEEEGKIRAEERYFGWAKSARESKAVQQASSARKEGVQQQGRGPNLARLHQQKKAENKRPYRSNFLSKEMRRRAVQAVHCWAIQPHLGWVLLLKCLLISAVRKSEFFCCNFSFLRSQ